MCKRTEDLTVVTMDDWVAWYRDGVKLVEGHRVLAQSLLSHLDMPFEEYWIDNEEYENGLPDALADIPEEHLEKR